MTESHMRCARDLDPKRSIRAGFNVLYKRLCYLERCEIMGIEMKWNVGNIEHVVSVFHSSNKFREGSIIGRCVSIL